MSKNGYVPHASLKRRLTKRGVSYTRIAEQAGVSWFMVWAVLNGRKTSRRVLDLAKSLSA